MQWLPGTAYATMTTYGRSSVASPAADDFSGDVEDHEDGGGGEDDVADEVDSDCPPSPVDFVKPSCY